LEEHKVGNATQTLGPLLGPLIGFLFTLGAVLFIALRADKTERPGALEALQAAATGAVPPESSPAGTHPGEAAAAPHDAEAPQAEPGPFSSGPGAPQP
jgi:hypothetical protein